MSPHAKNDAFAIEAIATPGWYETYVLPKIRRDESGCWLWMKTYSGAIYGHIMSPRALSPEYKQMTLQAHRVVWLRERGPIPVGYVLDHDGPDGCGNRTCCNPEHLQVVTIRHNTVVSGNSPAALNARKTTCSAGHALMQSSRGRICQVCTRSYGRKHVAKLAEAAAALGLGFREYKRRYGQSGRLAAEIISGSQGLVAA